MEVLFTIMRSAVLAVIVLVVWWIIAGAMKHRGFSSIIKALLQRTFAVVGITALVGAIGAGLIFGAIYALPKVFNMFESRPAVAKKVNGGKGNSPFQLVVEKTVASEQSEEASPPPLPPPPPKQEPYPVQSPVVKNMPNTPKFEVLARDGMTIVFFRKDGSKTGSIIRVIGDDAKTILAIPIESDSYAMIFPVRQESDCQYQTVTSGGRFVACKTQGPDKFGAEEWGVRYAYFDKQ